MENEPDLVIRDPHTGQDWTIPRRPVRSVIADAHERWMVNVALDPGEAARMVEAPFLDLELINGKAVMALCVISMNHAAPEWAPLHLGPAVLACALRIACRHQRTGEPAVWVATRHTDHILGRALPLLGFPDIQVGLRTLPGLQPGLAARGVLVAMRPGPAPASELFTLDTDFDAFIAAGVRSYGRGAQPGTWSAVDLVKDHASVFTRQRDRCARLVLDGMPWEVDSIYRCPGGRWRWAVHGAVDAQGHGLAGPLPPTVATYATLPQV